MMNFFSNRLFLFTSLIIYTLLLSTTLLYFRFPAEKLKLSCQYGLEQLLSVKHCSINQISYRFPFSMVASEITFSNMEGEGKQLFTIDQATLTPTLTAPTSGFLVTLNACSGKHDFTLLLNRTDKEFNLKDIHLTDLDLSQLPFLSQTTTRKISGKLEGNGSYHGSWDKGKNMAEGQGTIVLSKGSFGLLYPILSLKKIDLQHLAAELSFQENSLEFKKGTFNGQELKGDFSGMLELQSAFKTSTLSFRGKLDPLPPLLKKSKHAKNMVNQLKKRHNQNGLPFRLNGVVQKPSFRFDS